MLLRPTEVDDLDVFLCWVHDEEGMVLWSGPTFSWPLDRSQLEEYFSDPHRQYWTGIDGVTGAAIGHASLLIDDGQSCRLGFVILDPSRRGEGLGRKLVSQLMAMLIETKTEVTLGVYSHNIPARRLYESLGFRGREIALQTPVGDQVWNVVAMSHDLR